LLGGERLVQQRWVIERICQHHGLFGVEALDQALGQLEHLTDRVAGTGSGCHKRVIYRILAFKPLGWDSHYARGPTAGQ